MHVGIIGDGFSAAEAARLQIEKLASGDTLTIIGPNADHETNPGMLGRGLAYGYPKGDKRRRIEYLLNSPAGKMGDAFAVWIKKNIEPIILEMNTEAKNGNLKAAQWLIYNGQALGENRTDDIYFPRTLYGDFHNERVEEALHNAEIRGVTINTVTDIAKTIDQKSENKPFTIETEEHVDINVDSVFVSPGAPSPRQFSDLHVSDGNIPQLYGYESQIITQIRQSPDKPVLIIGGNAAMLDTIRMIRSYEDLQDQKITIVTPSGELPPSARIDTNHKRHYDLQILDPNTQYSSVETLLQTMINERNKGLADGYSVPAIRVAIQDAFLNLENMIPVGEMSNPRLSRIDYILRRGTPDAVDEVEQLIKQNVVQIIPGKVQKISKATHGVTVEIDQDQTPLTINPGLSINTTGSTSMAKAIHSDNNEASVELMRNLVNSGKVSLHPQTGHIEVGTGGETNIPGLFIISPAVGHKGGQTPPFVQYDVIQLSESAENAVNSFDYSYQLITQQELCSLTLNT